MYAKTIDECHWMKHKEKTRSLCFRKRSSSARSFRPTTHDVRFSQSCHRQLTRWSIASATVEFLPWSDTVYFRTLMVASYPRYAADDSNQSDIDLIADRRTWGATLVISLARRLPAASRTWKKDRMFFGRLRWKTDLIFGITESIDSDRDN